MNTRLLIIIGIITAALVYLLASDQYYLSFQDKELQSNLSINDNCGLKYIQVSDTCQLDPELIEPNTIVIYDMHRTQGSRTSIAPHSLVMNLTNGNTVTFVNNASNIVNILDNFKGVWKFEDVKPQTERSVIINGTGFYKILVQDTRLGSSGRIIALSDETNSLPVGVKARMAQGIIGVSRDMSEYGDVSGKIVSVGAGSVNPGITVGVLKSELKKYDDAETYYYNIIKNMIPFDVPITIKFREVSTLNIGTVENKFSTQDLKLRNEMIGRDFDSIEFFMNLISGITDEKKNKT